MDDESWTKAREPETIVYFVAGGGRTKIGVARDAKARLKHLRAFSPVPLRLVAAVEAGPDARTVEAAMHRHFRSRHSHGEWFVGELSRDEAMSALVACYPDRAWIELKLPKGGRDKPVQRRQLVPVTEWA